jgi:hypothetical protein
VEAREVRYGCFLSLLFLTVTIGIGIALLVHTYSPVPGLCFYPPCPPDPPDPLKTGLEIALWISAAITGITILATLADSPYLKSGKSAPPDSQD